MAHLASKSRHDDMRLNNKNKNFGERSLETNDRAGTYHKRAVQYCYYSHAEATIFYFIQESDRQQQAGKPNYDTSNSEDWKLWTKRVTRCDNAEYLSARTIPA